MAATSKRQVTVTAISFDDSNFQILDNNWIEPRMRRVFLEMFAYENGFDPLIGKNWFNVATDYIRKAVQPLTL